MKAVKRTLLLLALAAAAESAALSARAQPSAEPKSPHTLTGNVALVSQYVFRGVTQTNGKPAIQGGLDYSHASGVYVGTWLSNISWVTQQNAGTVSVPVSLGSPGSLGPPYEPDRSNSAHLEWDLYGGWKGSFASDWTYDVGAIRYAYPGRYDNVGAYRRPDTTEIYGAIGYKWLTLKYSKAVSRYMFGANESRGGSYLDLSASVPLADSGFTLLAHVGRQEFPGNANTGYWGASGGNNNFYDYTDYKLGVTKDYAEFTFGAAWSYAATRGTAPDGETTAYMSALGKNIGGSRFVLSVSRTF